jgi:hypothetical protein
MFPARTTRRQFLRNTVALGTACALSPLAAHVREEPPICPPLVQSARVHVRKDLAAFVQDHALLADFRRGVGRMRRMAPDHPFSWIFQANIHQRPNFPEYVRVQAAASHDPAQQLFREDPNFVPWPNVFNQCTHANWWFLPWHRAYVFYVERILRWACGNPHFALPYWNYADSGQRVLPLAFREPMAGGQPNPLYLPDTAPFTDDADNAHDFPMRCPTMNAGTTMLADPIVSLCPLTYLSFYNRPPALENECFGSSWASAPGTHAGKGALESPHGTVHQAIGGRGQYINGVLVSGFMFVNGTAARDPIFWMHHSNIDRLWESWLALKGGRMNPLDSEWLDQEFTFFDVHKGKPKPVTIRVCQLLDTRRQLGYEYDCLSTPPPDCRPALTPALHEIVRRLASTPAPFEAPAGMHGMSALNIDEKPIPIPLLAGVSAEGVQALATTLLRERNGALALSLEKLTVKQMPVGYYDLYLNLPQETKPSPTDPHFVGSLSFFGMIPQDAGHGHDASSLYLRFAFPQALLQLIAEKKLDVKRLMLTFAVETGKQPVGGVKLTPPRQKRSPISIARIQILQMR